MINKIFKIINNKFSRLFKFVFFIRYLFLIFFVAIALFLSIPQFFDYKKKIGIIKVSLFENYGLELKKIENISYNSLPVPHLEISNLSINFYSDSTNLITNKLIIYPKLLSIYNYKNFQIKKIKLENNDLKINYGEIKSIITKVFSFKNKIHLKNLNLVIYDNGLNIVELNKVNFLNYGYKKNSIDGKVFNKKFKINLKDDLSNLDLKLIDSGITASLNIIDYNQNSRIKGIFKGKVLKSKFKLNFVYDQEEIKIKDFYFRNKQLSFDSKGHLKFKPFFYTNLTSKIKNINPDLLRQLDIEELLSFKDLIKKLNTQHNINFEFKKFSKNLINTLDIKINLAYGRLNLFKKLFISNSNFNCESNVNLLDEFPILYFNCFFNSSETKDLLKKIKINRKLNKDDIKLNIKGNVNVLNKKINFDNLELNNDYKATKEDLKYYKSNFEKILFDQDFIQIFNLSKIRKFMLEIL